MQYNGENNNQDICTFADDLVGTDDSTYPLEKKTRAANQAMRMIWTWIWDAFGGWVYDDNNNADLPDSTATLSSGQSIYTLPIETQHLLGVAVKNTGGTWSKLTPISQTYLLQHQAEPEFYETDSIPQYYVPVGNTIKLYPAPNYTQTASLGVWTSRDISGFDPDDTTKKPGFDSIFHEAVPTFMALRHADINQLSVKTDLAKDWDGNEAVTGVEGGYKKAIKKHYQQKFRELYPPTFKHQDSVQEFM